MQTPAPRLLLQDMITRWGAKPVIGLTATINLSVNPGEWLGVVGFNGVGKSTLLKTIAGIGRHVEGVISIDGAHVPAYDLDWRFFASVHTVSQAPPLTGHQLRLADAHAITFSRRPGLENHAAIACLLTRFRELGLIGPRDTITPRVFELLTALLAVPSVLLIDEIVLDPSIHGKETGFYRTLRDLTRHTAVLFTDHDFDRLYRWCDRLLWLREERAPRIVEKDDSKIIAAMKDVFRSERVSRTRRGVEDEETWMSLISDEENPIAELRLAIRSNRSLRPFTEQAISLVKQVFPFFIAVCQCGELSGGQRVIFLFLFSVLAGIESPPEILVKSLDGERKRRLGEVITAIRAMHT